MENITGYPIELSESIKNHCGSAYLYCCNKTISNYIMPITHRSLSSFLINLFMQNNRNNKFLDYIFKKKSMRMLVATSIIDQEVIKH